MKEISKAIIKVMQEVKGIEKSMTVGSGNNSYKGVADQEVKQIIGDAMAKNGLCLLPISVDAKTQIDRWEEVDTYSKVAGTMKSKQSVFTEVKTKYMLIHESGESIELSGYGHGIDSQDKGAGKATTYALKYTLLYTFLVPTGKIDDADNHHSDSLPAKPAQKTNPIQPETLSEEVMESLHNEFMKSWNEYRDLTSDKLAGQYHPENWKTRTMKAYQLAIPTMNQKLKELKAKQPV